MRDTRPDMPDGTSYPDNGCRIHPSCLSCPLAVCIHDAPERVQRSKMRFDEIQARLNRGISVAAIAREFGVSARTIFRQRLKG